MKQTPLIFSTKKNQARGARPSTQKRGGTATFLTLGTALALSCAQVSVPDNESATAEGDESMGGASAIGGTTMTPTSSGGSASPGGGTSTGGIPESGGGGSGATTQICDGDSDCVGLPGCNSCVLNEANFLFECQPDATSTECGAECADLQTDTNHCGACNARCPSGLFCESGSCKCAVGEDQCDNTCTDLTKDVNNCGTCGKRCEGGTPFCSSGSCVACVTPGQTACSGGCADLETDTANCGICGRTCDAARSQVCVEGACEDPGSCASPDVSSYSNGSCTATTVYKSALYECISSNIGNCGTTGVFCQTLAPDQVPWGPKAWKRLLDCP